METVRIDIGEGRFTTIDATDAQLLGNIRWSPTRHDRSHTIYARGLIHGEKILLHRLIMGAPRNTDVDHRDGDGLNNTRTNLRVVTHRQNMANTKLSARNKTGFKGVTHTCARERHPFAACVCTGGRTLHLGTYATAEEAARAYDAAARELFGEYARTNVDLGLLAR